MDMDTDTGYDTESIAPPSTAMKRSLLDDDEAEVVADVRRDIIAQRSQPLVTTRRPLGGVFNFNATLVPPLASSPHANMNSLLAQNSNMRPVKALPWRLTFPTPHYEAVAQAVGGVYKVVYIRLPPEYQGRGLGRRLFGALQQNMSLNPDDGPQVMRVKHVHYPTFRVLDAFFHWVPVWENDDKKGRLDVMLDTAPRLLYPRHLDYSDDVAVAGRQEQENRIATNEPVDTMWMTPAVWHECRMRYFQTMDDPALDLATWNKGFVRALVDSARGVNASTRRRLRANHIDFEPRIDTIDYAGTMVGMSPAFREHVAAYCRDLGNMDDDAAPDAIYLDSEAIRLESSLSQTPQHVRLLGLLFQFLVDMGRVFQWPLVIHADCADVIAKLVRIAYRRDDWTRELATEEPRPAWTPLAGGHWLWLPQRKAASTNDAGSIVIPMPLAEQELPLVRAYGSESEDADAGADVFYDDVRTQEAARKKPRLSARCASCSSTNVQHTDLLHFYCSAACRDSFRFGIDAGSL
jgi:hypothetical protein